ncbi:MAG: hypothetical protein WBB64_13815 [Anaerolineales bacterium]
MKASGILGKAGKPSFRWFSHFNCKVIYQRRENPDCCCIYDYVRFVHPGEQVRISVLQEKYNRLLSTDHRKQIRKLCSKTCQIKKFWYDG